MIPFLENPPLDGFDLHWVPTKALPSIAAELRRMARYQRNGWPGLSAKMHDRAEFLESQWTMTAEAAARVGHA
jgi:hypothetical protein